MPQDLITAMAADLAVQLPAGVFLSVGGKKPNTMTVGWGGYTFFWRKPVFLAPIRPQRHSHDLLLSQGAFTVSIPDGDMKAQLQKAGTLSGRDGDKFAAMGLATAKARELDAPIVLGCKWQLECRLLASTAFEKGQTDLAIANTIYPGDDFHTLFFGEIIACYQTEKAH